jgi:hypothetical protein
MFSMVYRAQEQVGSQADAGNLSFSMLRKMEELLDRHAAYRTQRSVSVLRKNPSLLLCSYEAFTRGF